MALAISLQRLGFLATLLALALLVFACGGDDDDDDSGGGSETTATVASEGDDDDGDDGDDGGSSASNGDGCHVDVTGDIEASWNGPDDLAAIGTDYWYTNEELQ